MHKNIDEICNAIDAFVLRRLELMEEKISATVQMEALLRNGHIELAKARYIRGKESVSALQIPINGDNITPLFELETKLTEEASEIVPCFDISFKDADKIENDIQDPIKWFGVLVPQNLRTAQKRFQESIYLAIKVANIQTELDFIDNKLKNLYLLKSALCKTKDTN